MSKIDYQALRAKAEKATKGSYIVGHTSVNRHGNLTGVFVCQKWKGEPGGVIAECHVNCLVETDAQAYANAEFIAEANPATVLVLLDELEAAAEPDDLSEWADMQFLLWDAQRRAGISDAEITAAMENKLKINMERQWPEPKDGEPRLHIKEPGNSPVIPDGWISCSERMPDDGQHVIILCDGAFVLYAQYRDGEFFDVVRNGEEFFETQSRNVTHWMPLPEPPKEVNQ
ncbi:DUF550 domain-containing protein [Escherichia coli]|nr:DUF550 domain-containing protein [Escherichia coli]